MEQPVFEAIDELEYPELYDEAIPVLTFFKYLRQLLDAAGYHDISMRVNTSFWPWPRTSLTFSVSKEHGFKAICSCRTWHSMLHGRLLPRTAPNTRTGISSLRSLLQDLTKPEEHRLRRQLSAVVNFARFREGKLELYLNWQEETEVLLREQAELAEANAQLVGIALQHEQDSGHRPEHVCRQACSAPSCFAQVCGSQAVLWCFLCECRRRSCSG